MEEFTSFFKALSDKTRLRIINLLCKSSSELCVCEIVDSLEESQYNISRHLKELKIVGLVEEKKKGRWVFYSLKNPTNCFHETFLKTVLAIPDNVFRKEQSRLKKRLTLRKNGECIVGINSKEWSVLRENMEKCCE